MSRIAPTSTFAPALVPALLVSALGLASAPAQAVDWSGYFRAGPASTGKDAARACYGLSGPGLKYRLGNECDIYGEFVMSQGLKSEGVDYKATLMTNLWNPQTDTGSASMGIAQMFAEGKGYDIAPNTNFWIGKRYYGRADVHIVDTFFTKLDGVGGGAEVPLSFGKLGLAYFNTADSSTITTTQSGNRFNIDLSDMAVNKDGKLRVVLTSTQGNFTGGEAGAGLTVQHTQDKFLGLGGANTVWVQAAQGSADLNGNFGTLTNGSSVKSTRLVESFTWQVGAFGGQALAMVQNDDNAGVKTASSSIGGRLSYAFTRNFKLLTEIGHSEKKPDGSDAQKLTKITIAPTLAVGPGFWNRPELRLYVTHATWNDAANAASGANGLIGAPALSGNTSGTSAGLQAEMWF